MSDAPLLDWTPPDPPAFGGETFDVERDGARLNAQCARVYQCMKDGQWRTLKDISAITGDPEASISARLRDLKKPEFKLGAKLHKRYEGDGLWAYRVELPAA